MKFCVLIPAYNCAHIIDQVVQRLTLPGPDDEIIVVDDSSRDNTLEVARALPRVYAVRNAVNLGYGGTSQRLYEIAFERGADCTVNLHGDLGHRPEDVPLVLQALLEGQYDLVMGSRLKYLMDLRDQHGWRYLFSAQARQNMPLSRVSGHFGLTWFQNKCFRTNSHSFHEGSVVPEYNQDDATPENRGQPLGNLVLDRVVKGRLTEVFREMHLELRQGTSERAAAAILSCLKPAAS